MQETEKENEVETELTNTYKLQEHTHILIHTQSLISINHKGMILSSTFIGKNQEPSEVPIIFHSKCELQSPSPSL